MTTITISKKLIKDNDLVIIPRREYEKFLYIFEIIPKDQWWFWTKEWQKKEEEADKNIKLRNLSGPHKTIEGLKTVLDKMKKM